MINERRKDMEMNRLSDVPGFEGFAEKLLQDKEIHLNDKMMATSEGVFLILGQRIYTGKTNTMPDQDYHGEAMEINLALAYSEKAIVVVSFQWYVLNGEYNHVTWYDHFADYWFRSDAWPAKYAKEVINAFNSDHQEINEDEEIDEDEYFNNLPEWAKFHSTIECSHRYDPISWLGYLAGNVSDFVDKRIANQD